MDIDENSIARKPENMNRSRCDECYVIAVRSLLLCWPAPGRISESSAQGPQGERQRRSGCSGPCVPNVCMRRSPKCNGRRCTLFGAGPIRSRRAVPFCVAPWFPTWRSNPRHIDRRCVDRGRSARTDPALAVAGQHAAGETAGTCGCSCQTLGGGWPARWFKGRLQIGGEWFKRHVVLNRGSVRAIMPLPLVCTTTAVTVARPPRGSNERLPRSRTPHISRSSWYSHLSSYGLPAQSSKAHVMAGGRPWPCRDPGTFDGHVVYVGPSS